MVPAIVLAAGLSSRMGDFKPLMELCGKKVLVRGVEGLIGSGVISRVVVVTGHRAGEIEEMVRREWGGRAETVFNKEYASGEMLSSVRAGSGALAGEVGKSAGFLLAFADQPSVEPVTVRRIVEEFVGSNAPLAMPTFLGKRGHPVVFSWELLPAIAALSAGDTLRTVVHQQLSRALLIPVEDSSILDDLDTPEDFARAEARLGRGGRQAMTAVNENSAMDQPGGAHG